MYRSRMASLPSTNPEPSRPNLIAYRLPATPLSASLARFHDRPPFSVLNRLPLPPHAKPMLLFKNLCTHMYVRISVAFHCSLCCYGKRAQMQCICSKNRQAVCDRMRNRELSGTVPTTSNLQSKHEPCSLGWVFHDCPQHPQCNSPTPANLTIPVLGIVLLPQGHSLVPRF